MPKSKAKRSKKSKLTQREKGLFRFQGLGDFTSGVENKFYDQSIALIGSSSNEPFVVSPIVGLQQNSTASGRDGDRIWVKSLSVKVRYTKPNQTLGGSETMSKVRWDWRLVVDKQTNGSTLTVSDYQETPTARPNGGLSVFQPKLSTSKRFTTLKTGRSFSEQNVSYNNDLDDAVGHHEIFLRFPGKGMEVVISNTDGLITGFKSNNLYLLLQNNDHSTWDHTYHVYSRIRFAEQ